MLWGPGGLTVEDNCTWVPKPDGTPKYDGVCQCESLGTQATQAGIAEEDFDESLIAAVRLWAEAMTAPAEEGGGLIDPDLAEMALSLFDDQDAAQRIGREIGSLMVLVRGENFFFHPDHEHLMEEHLVADLSEDPCRVEAGNLAVEALVSELQEPGSGGQFLDAIPSSCPDWQGMFVPFCDKGPGALDCVLEAIQETAGVMVVPPRNNKKLDLTWTVSVNGQPVQVAPHGTFTVRNISAPDFFGDGGPGTPPDFVSDDFVRVTGISTEFGITRYAFSEFFQITQGQTFVIQDLTITDTPPPFPESIRVTAAESAMGIGATTQLTTIATLPDGTQQDVTPRSAWTTYRVSNPDIVTVEEDVNEIVRAVAHSVGPVLITATNEGATSVVRIDVTADLISSTVDGFVQLADQTPVADITVSAVSVLSGLTTVVGSAISDADGHFSIPLIGIPVEAGVRVAVTADVAGQALTASVQADPLVRDGFTDVGIIVLEPVIEDAFSREFSVYNDLFDETIVDAFSREFSVYNDLFDETITDAVSREFSVFNDPP